jgi:hypothetical protein
MHWWLLGCAFSRNTNGILADKTRALYIKDNELIGWMCGCVDVWMCGCVDMWICGYVDM